LGEKISIKVLLDTNKVLDLLLFSDAAAYLLSSVENSEMIYFFCNDLYHNSLSVKPE